MAVILLPRSILCGLRWEENECCVHLLWVYLLQQALETTAMNPKFKLHLTVPMQEITAPLKAELQWGERDISLLSKIRKN